MLSSHLFNLLNMTQLNFAHESAKKQYMSSMLFNNGPHLHVSHSADGISAQVFHKKAPQFCNEIAEKTLCVGLSTVRFRDAESSSHEVYVDRGQIEWFEEVLERHPASQGWKVLVFSHAPILGSNLRTLQDVHVKNGCAWINHGDQKTRRVFIELCRKHECITAWFSGHFHLSHDYKESITTGGSGQAFVQVGVIGERSQRDGRRQSRLVTGDDKGLKIFTINHHLGGKKRLDMEIVFSAKGGAPHQFVLPDNHQEWIKPGGDQWFSAHVPLADDGCFLKNFYEKHQCVFSARKKPTETFANHLVCL
jgi:hypothetical protein